MTRKPIRRFTLILTAWLGGAVLLLWSWNSLVGLFDLPRAEFKHAVAAVTIVLVLRTCLLGGPRSGRVCSHGHPT